MTDALLLDSGSALPACGDDRAVVRGLGDELLAEHEDAGDRVAALVDENSVMWQAARPWVAQLVTEARQTMRELARLGGREVPGDLSLSALDPVPPVVWARELGVVQRDVCRAVRGLEGEQRAEQQAAVLRAALGRTSTVVMALRAVALA